MHLNQHAVNGESVRPTTARAGSTPYGASVSGMPLLIHQWPTNTAPTTVRR